MTGDARGGGEPRPVARNEGGRKLIHAGCGLFALLLPVLSRPQAVLLALAGFVFNLYVLRRLPGGERLFRVGERLTDGIVVYPLTVLLAILVLPYPHASAAVWGVLAFGDAAAGVVGRAFGGPRLAWNRHKTWIGTLAFLIVAVLAAVGLAVFAGRPVDLAWRPAVAAAVAAAVAETLPLRVDDNILVVAAAGAAWLGVEALVG